MNGYMRELNTRQKLRYLWDYYRIRIGLGVLAVIAVIAALAHARTKPDIRLSVGMINLSSGNAAGVLKDGKAWPEGHGASGGGVPDCRPHG